MKITSSTSLYTPNPDDPRVNTLSSGRAGNPTDSKATARSVYAFDSIEFNKHWHAGLGLRVDNYMSSLKSSAYNLDRMDTLVNYQLGLVYKPVDNGSFYISYATSSTPFNASAGEDSDGSTPGRRNTGLNAADLAPEKNCTYEIGTKWDVLGKSLTLTAAVFRTETVNARITQLTWLKRVSETAPPAFMQKLHQFLASAQYTELRKLDIWIGGQQTPTKAKASAC